MIKNYPYSLGFLLIHLLLSFSSKAAHPDIYFTPNHGQWKDPINFSLRMNSGFLYLEDSSFTYLFLDQHEHYREAPAEEHIAAHALRWRFKGASPSVRSIGESPSTFYSNFFLSSSPNEWKTKIHSFYQIRYKDLYSGIDMLVRGTEDAELKYDLLVNPNADPSQIKMEYEGAEKVFISSSGELHVVTSLGTLIEKKPVAWQTIDGEKKPVQCRFTIDLKENGNTQVRFELGEEYDPMFPLVIDPVLVFSTFSGSTADNFGFTATYDIQKNTFGGGIVFPSGQYPVTSGAFQTGFNGVTLATTRDAAITKFNQQGTGLLYSTYLGGTGTEAPHSLVCDDAGNLFVMGTTSSTDFPMLPTAYDNSYSGGTSITPPNSGIIYSGTDIFVVKFNPGGTALLGTTYVGGTGNDGINSASVLAYNYGDMFRGEIILDGAGNCIVASVSSSNNFPVTGTAPQPIFGGGATDGVVFRLNNNLSSLLWSTYIGGSNDDSSYGVELDSNGEIYVTGGTKSNNLLVSPGVIGSAYFGGQSDGYLVRYTSTGNAILSMSYIGTAGYDQCFFVQIDLNDDIYVLGQSDGSYPVTSGVYNNPNSGQFIHKLNKSFTTTVFSTTIGRSTGAIDISPCAFLVNKCGQIYLSGWGGSLNGISPYLATASNTSGLPITSDAIQATTDGNDFYLMILEENAASLLYATYFGGNVLNANEHVDGGTSRFDKDGVIYQAVCGGCGGNSAFPTTPGAWSNANLSSNCNLVVFKIDLKEIIAEALFNFTSDPCTLPATIQLQNNSIGALSYEWDFGDGSGPSSSTNPSHTYSNSGWYTVTLVALDSNTCSGVDTALVDIYIPGPLTATGPPPSTICVGDSIQLNASGGQSYVWSPFNSLSDPLIADPFAFPLVTTQYSVIVSDTNNCRDTAFVDITVLPFVESDFSVNFTPCELPVDVNLSNSSQNGTTYFWDLGDGNTTTQTDVLHTYLATGNYTITLIANNPNSCNQSDTSSFTIFVPPPASINAYGEDTICIGQSVTLFAEGADQYLWIPAQNFPGTDTFLVVTPQSTTDYLVIGIDSNGCSDTSIVTVNVFPVSFMDAGPDQLFDIGDQIFLNPSIPPGGTFIWTPSFGLSCDTCPNPEVLIEQNAVYYLQYTDPFGCVYLDSVIIQVTPSVFIPNAFTPNFDDKNNIFYPVVRNLATMEFYIFDRWGELIFYTDDPNKGWDGSHKGRQCPIGVYVWKLKYTDFLEPDIVKEKYGHVTLIR